LLGTIGRRLEAGDAAFKPASVAARAGAWGLERRTAQVATGGQHGVLPDRVPARSRPHFGVGASSGDEAQEAHKMLTLDVECRLDGTAAIAAVGEVDAATAARLSAAVHRQLDRMPSMLMLDLHEVTFLGVAGLRVLQCAANRATASGVPLQLVYRDPSPVHSALEAAGMASAFPVAPSAAGASATPTKWDRARGARG
jgi:anti-anti-sigma factor